MSLKLNEIRLFYIHINGKVNFRANSEKHRIEEINL